MYDCKLFPIQILFQVFDLKMQGNIVHNTTFMNVQHACVCVCVLFLTCLSQLVLVIVQSLIVAHTDPAHPDPQSVWDWLLTETQNRTGTLQTDS